SRWFPRAEGSPAGAEQKFNAPPMPAVRLGPAPDGPRRVLVELRSSGSQTVVPPSVHPGGDPYVWYSFGEPAPVALADHEKAVSSVAAAALLARHWPGLGARHDARLALAGGLLRNGYPAGL